MNIMLGPKKEHMITFYFKLRVGQSITKHVKMNRRLEFSITSIKQEHTNNSRNEYATTTTTKCTDLIS